MADPPVLGQGAILLGVPGDRFAWHGGGRSSCFVFTCKDFGANVIDVDGMAIAREERPGSPLRIPRHRGEVVTVAAPCL